MNTQEMKNKLDQDYLIIRDDDVVIRDCFGFPETLCTKWEPSYFNAKIIDLNEKAEKYQINHTYRVERIFEYKKAHPDFKF